MSCLDWRWTVPVAARMAAWIFEAGGDCPAGNKCRCAASASESPSPPFPDQNFAKNVSEPSVKAFEGVVVQELAGTVGLFLATSGFSARAKASMMRSPYPLLFGVLALNQTQFTSLFINASAQTLLPQVNIVHHTNFATGQTRAAIRYIDGKRDGVGA
eukprot:m.112164 g.112164  ORF g.112164 m.112164 type:complete len:158 (+) comp19265_c1_seq3:95-568(+)